MRKKRTITQWINRLDKLWTLAIRSNNVCNRCYREQGLQAAHINSRINKSTRWDLENGLLLCVRCHFWAHQNPLDFTEFVKSRLGLKRYNALRKKTNTTKHFKEEDYLKVEKELLRQICLCDGQQNYESGNKI